MKHTLKPPYPPEVTNLEFDDTDIAVCTFVRRYILEHLGFPSCAPNFDVYIILRLKSSRFWKFRITSTIPDCMFYELTYNVDEHEWCFDVYRKYEHRCLEEEDLNGDA